VIVRGGWLFDSIGDDVVRNTGIVIRGGSFREVGADLSGRDLSGSEVISLAEDDYILPGVFDLHAHYSMSFLGLGRADETVAYPVIFLANGVTSTFPAGEYNPVAMMELRKQIDRGERIGPRIFNSGPYFGTTRAGWNREFTAEDIYREVDYWAERGVKGFKAKGIAPEHLKPLIERAHQHGLTVTGHFGSGRRNSVNPKAAILMGIDRVEHFLGGDALPSTASAYGSLAELDVDDPRVDEIIDLYVKWGVVFDATISAYGAFGELTETFDHWVDERKFFTPYAQQQLRAGRPRGVNQQFEKIYWVKRQTAKKFYDAGGTLTLGTDHPSWGDFLSGFFWHREIDVFVRIGIPPADAIKIATINGARAMNVGDKLGTIEPGKFADLMIIKGNPLEDIRNTRNVHHVMKSGVLYDSAKLLESVEGKIGPAGEK
jgi:imidazolonepropionase-like amidohydrolase